MSKSKSITKGDDESPFDRQNSKTDGNFEENDDYGEEDESAEVKIKF